jgi:hypothetical protein
MVVTEDVSIEVGDAETTMDPFPVGAVMVTVVVPVSPREDASISTDPACVPVRTAEAVPLAFVVAVAVTAPLKFADVLLTVKVTEAPGTGFELLSRSVAVIVDVPFTRIEAGTADTLSVPPLRPLVMIMETLLLMLPIDPVTTTTAFVVPAVNVTAACPVASVTAVALERVPRNPLSREKVTVAFATGPPMLSTT